MARKSNRSLWTAKLTGKPMPGALPEEALMRPRRPFDGVVLGVDPSLRGTGLALVEFRPGGEPRLLASETVRNRPKLSFTECLGEIARRVTVMLDHSTPPDCLALEQTIYVQNFQTAQILGAARGAAIAPAAMRGVAIFEYAPLRIKQAVVGAGRASKEQVASTMRHHLRLLAELPSDESDAAAAACCHAWTWRG
ncbi:MAG: crossover junction endodeoxyribonuclease RuvC [Verrucomicrobiota bacterium JB024]|nr:crossover junction endodeoxyribonuclease RuvC [Verrucomicrobiota bacterium JB024]